MISKDPIKQRKTFAATLRAYRTQTRTRLRELAEAIGMSLSYISSLESGTLKPPSAEDIRRMAEVMELDSFQTEDLMLLGKIYRDTLKIELYDDGSPFQEAVLGIVKEWNFMPLETKAAFDKLYRDYSSHAPNKLRNAKVSK